MQDKAKMPTHFDPKKPRNGETIGGGYIVMRRGKKTGRVSIKSTLPFEYGSYDQAKTEAERLKKQNPKETFVVFGMMPSEWYE